MPTYEYECSRCHQTFEVFQSITAKPLTRMKGGCPKCGEDGSITRLIGTGAALLFKGNGFYQTDYRSEDYKKAVKAENDNSAGSKSDSQPDAATKIKGGDKKPPAKTPPATKPSKGKAEAVTAHRSRDREGAVLASRGRLGTAS